MMLSRILWLTVGVSVAPLLIGCGSEDPFNYKNVSGTVKYEDESLIPAGGIRLMFVPQSAEAIDKKTVPRPGHADVKVADGTFDVVSTYDYDDGLVPGTHKVVIESVDENSRPSKDVPAEYGNVATTPVTVDTTQLPFDIRVKKPAE